MLAQMIVEAPKYGASSRAAAISVPRLAAPTTNTIARTRAGAECRPATPTSSAEGAPRTWLLRRARRLGHEPRLVTRRPVRFRLPRSFRVDAMLLYDSAVSGNCYKVRLLLAQLGIASSAGAERL